MRALDVALIQRLQQGTPSWHSVAGLMALSELADRPPKRLPALFVVPLSEQARPDVRGSGPALQTLKVELGVVLVVAARNQQQPDLTPLRAEIRQRLFGWQPDDTAEPLALAGGQLMSVQSGSVAWLDTFHTEYTEDANPA